MELFVHLSKVLVGNVRIDLGRADVAVSQHYLDAAQVSAIHEQICGKTMPHCMRTDVFRYACKFSVLVDNSLNTPRT